MARNTFFFVFVALLLAVGAQAGKLWGLHMDKKKDKDDPAPASDSLAMEGGEDILGGGLGFEDLALGLATGELNYVQLMTEVADQVIKFVEDPSQRALFEDPMALKDMVSSLPGMSQPEIAAMMPGMLNLDAVAEGLQALDPAEYRQQMDTMFDAMGAKARALKAAAGDPDKLRALADETLESFGLEAEQRHELLQVLSDPAAMYQQWKDFAADPKVMESFEEAAALMQDPKAMEEAFAEMMKDPALRELLEDPAMQELVNDPVAWAELMGSFGAGGTGGTGGTGAMGGAGAFGGAGGAGRLPRRRPANFRDRLQEARL